ncbi:MAG: DUF4397 domain-containing protein [Gemmatimonas sp.]
MTNAAMRFARMVMLAGATASVVMACGTKEADDPLSPSGPTGRVRFVNVINDTTRGRVNAILELVPFGVNMTYTMATPATLAAPNTANYAAILTGNRTLVLKRTIDTNTVVATFPFTVTASQDRTIYAVGGAAGSAITSFISNDENTDVAATSTRLRVVNLSPGAGAVDVFVTAVGADLALATPVATGLANQNASAYFTVAAGTYQVRAVPAGTAPAARAAAVSINIASTAFPGGTGRTIVMADRNIGGAPYTAFVLTDK